LRCSRSRCTRAPDFSLPDLDGRTVSLGDFAGRPVWINIWASWCAPCRAEMPDISAVYQEVQARDAQAGRSDGPVLLLVSIGEDPAAVRRFLENGKYRLPVLLDPAFSVTERYRVNGLPTHYFVGRDGTIRDLAIGGLKPNAMRARLAKIA
jgi:cytochrome c biogenesis protein CcmG, thiol:disulfide interchange protein DsbE